MRFNFTDKPPLYVNSAQVEFSSQSIRNSLVKFTIFLVIVLVVNYINNMIFLIEIDVETSVQLFYPLTGIYITYSLLSHRRDVIGIFFASLVVTLVNQVPMTIALASSLIRLGIYLLVNHFGAKMQFSCNTIKLVEMKKLSFFSLFAVISNAVLLSLVLFILGHTTAVIYVILLGDFIMGDSLGILVATPLSLYVIYPLYRLLVENYHTKTLKTMFTKYLKSMSNQHLLGLLVAMGYISFIWWIIHLLDLYLLFLVLLIPLIFISLYYTFKTTIITNTLIGLVSVELINFHQDTINSFAIQLQYGIVIFLTILIAVLFENQRLINQELENSQATLLRAEKLQLMKKIAASTAHDFKNIFFAISGFNELQNLYISNLPKNTINLDNMLKSNVQIENSIHRGVELVNQLMASSQELEVVIDNIDLNPVMEQIYSKYVNLAGKHIRLILNLEPRTITIRVNQLNFEHMIHNLVDNSLESITGSGTVMITTKIYSRGMENPINDKYVMIEVADTGCGVAISDQERIFEPFYTTKQHGLGTGLSFVKEMVKSQNGMLEMDTSEGHGTKIRIFLPVEHINVSSKSQLPSGNELKLSNARIVILDDDEELVNLYTSYLEAKNMGAKVFTDPDEYLLYVQSHHDQIDLIISDILLRDGINGIDLRNELVANYPNLDFLFITAYFKQFTDNYEFLDPDHLLTKPFSYEDLSQKILYLLNKKSNPIL